jgi:hypothetical protein
LYCKIHFTFLKVAQPEVVVHTGFVRVEINRYFEFVDTRVKISKLSVVYS